MSAENNFDAVIIGAGFAGMYALHKIRGLGFKVKAYERASDVGGTWFWNRYPGARCDVNSLEYSYQFSDELQQEWSWSERYSSQPEILSYAKHVSERFDLRKDIQFETKVTQLEYDENSDVWHGQTDRGEEFTSRIMIMATGCLSKSNTPQFEGLNQFEGQLLHTAQWPHTEVDFAGKDVGVIGTGSSAIQLIPIVAEQAKTLTVFQRTANFSIPAHNSDMDKKHEAQVKANYKEFRAQNSLQRSAIGMVPNPVSALEVSDEEREQTYEERWSVGGLPFAATFNDLGIDRRANSTAVDFVHRKIRDIVKDEQTADTLCPDTVLGCKRLCVDSNYYETFNRGNIFLVDIKKNPIKNITRNGLVTADKDFKFDSLILATGFDAMTGALADISITGREKQTLASHWSEGPQNYLGLMVSGFPNMFTITGPGSPSVLSNMIVAIEQHVNFITNLLDFMKQTQRKTVETSEKAETEWVKQVNAIAAQTLYTSGCNSWYLGANIPGKPRIFMPHIGFPTYVEKCNEVAAQDYRGFKFSY